MYSCCCTRITFITLPIHGIHGTCIASTFSNVQFICRQSLLFFLSETLSYYAVLTTPGDFRLLGQSKILPAGLLFNFERIFPKIARNIFALPFCLQVDSIVVVGIAIQNINYTYSLYTGTYCDVLLLVSPYQTSNHTYSFHRYI